MDDPKIIYVEKFIVRYSEVDMYNNLKIRSVFDYLQQVAATHATILGCGWDNMQKNQQIWVLQRMSLNIQKTIKAGDVLTVKTYPSGRERLFFRREFEVLAQSGEVVAVGSSYWLVIDGATLRPTRNINVELPEEIESYSRYCDYDNALKVTPDEIQNNFRYSNEFEVNYSSIDVNLHLNNANYPMLVQDALYGELQKKFNFKKFQISFNIACKLDEKIRVFYKIENQEFKVAGVTDDNKIIFESAGTIEF